MCRVTLMTHWAALPGPKARLSSNRPVPVPQQGTLRPRERRPRPGLPTVMSLGSTWLFLSFFLLWVLKMNSKGILSLSYTP